MSLQHWAETLIAHNLAYTFLSKVFYEQPDLDFLRTITQEDLFDDWPLDMNQTRAEIGLAQLRTFSAHWHDDQFPDLKRDYARLFVGPDKLLATPWESVYRSAEGIIFEKETLQVRTFYREFDMPIPHFGSEPDDHIGLEFRFVAHLCAIGLNAIQVDDTTTLEATLDGLRRFFDEHISQWADQCLDRVSQHAQTDYYRSVAALASGCIAHSQTVFVS
jgi:putative dimethyl sulfoxide reductase chaperone